MVDSLTPSTTLAPAFAGNAVADPDVGPPPKVAT